MKPPSRAHDPKWSLAATAITLLVIIAYLASGYMRSTWVPAPPDALAGLCGLVLAAACLILPDRLAYRRDRDGLCRTLLEGKLPRHRQIGSAVWGGVTGVLIVLGTREFFSHFALCYLSGALVAVLVNGGHHAAVWKRMWELFEAEKSQNTDPSTAILAPPSAP